MIEAAGERVALVTQDRERELARRDQLATLLLRLRRDGDEARAGGLDPVLDLVQSFQLRVAVRSPVATKQRHDERSLSE